MLTGAPGLPYGNVGFKTNGFRISAEKASRSASICCCISGIGQELVHFSKILMCRVKYSRASVFKSGSGDVSATYRTLALIVLLDANSALPDAALCRSK